MGRLKGARLGARLELFYVQPVSCGVVQMVVGPDQLGAHFLMDWDLDRNVDVINVWNRNAVFCGDVPAGKCSIFPVTPDGAVVNELTEVSWGLASSDHDADGIAGIRVLDGNFYGNISINFNFN
jgi:hypothetical protein